MERIVDYKFSQLISAGFDLLPPGMANKLRYTHFFTGTSPIYAGLFDYEKASLGRSYHTTWCVACPYHQTNLPKSLRHTTIVLPRYKESGYPLRLQPMLIVHELGHVLDEILRFDHKAEPVTKYAMRNNAEAFAEAFTLWLNPGYEEYYDIFREVDEGTLSLFREIENRWN